MWPADWRVLHASFVTETAGSTIWRVRLVGAPGTAVAKVLKPAADAADELRGAHYLRWRAGEGAVRLLAEDGLMLLLEDGGVATLESLPDAAAMPVAADVLARLHQPRPAPAALQPLHERFGALFRRVTTPHDAAYALAADIAHELLDALHTPVALHGDLHHDNVVHGARGWLAIDPKGLLGDAAFDAANWFYNPWGQDALHRQAERIAALAQVLAAPLGCTSAHVLRHAVAYGGLSAAWFAEDGDVANERRTLTTLQAVHAAWRAGGF